MKFTQALTMAIAAVVLIGGMAAVGAASPADQAPDTASDTYDENAPQDAGDDENGSDGAVDAADMSQDGNESAESVGPSGGLPEQAPDHVSQIHETIQSYLGGSIDSIGDALSNMLGGESGANGSDGGPNADAGSA